PEHGADAEKERELQEHGDAARQQRQARLCEVPGGEQTLHDELIGAVACRREKCTADDAGPEGIGFPEVEAEIEDTELSCCSRGCVDVMPSARNKVKQGEEADDGPANVNEGLDHVGPDDGGESAFERIDERQ